jgi:hypothetical protein
MSGKKKTGSSRDQRRMRTQQIVFAIIAVILILSWVITLINPF